MTSPPHDSAVLTAADAARAKAIQTKARIDALATEAQRRAFWQRRTNPTTRAVLLLGVLGAVATPFILAGALLGFRRAYLRILAPQGKPPALHPLDPAARYGLVYGAAVFGPLLIIAAVVLWLGGRGLLDFLQNTESEGLSFLFAWLVGWGAVSAVMLAAFMRWLNRTQARYNYGDQYGSARFAALDELTDYREDVAGSGLLLGLAALEGEPTTNPQPPARLVYPRDGHALTVAGTRGGKGVNLIVPNLLKNTLGGSYVIVDPKGENAAITAARMGEHKRVYVLNPWGMLPDALGNFRAVDALGRPAAATFNPLDLIDPESPNLVDDVDLIAEMLVPFGAGGRDDDHWSNRARSFIAGFLVHLMTSNQYATRRNLVTLWEWLRLPTLQLAELGKDLTKNPVPAARATGDDLLSMMQGNEKEFAGIMSTAKRYTDFLKSPALAASLRSSSFSPYDLTAGNVAVYVVIPAEYLKTHYQWLRLVVTTCMRATLRNPDQRVTFLLDEAAALGYISEAHTMLSLGAGYGITLWNVFQDLNQVKALYGDGWETVLAASAVRQFFTIRDTFTADYLSFYCGSRTYVKLSAITGDVEQTNARALMTPDEIMRVTRDNMLTFVDQGFPVLLPKSPYFLDADMAGLADPNPYYGRRAA